MVNTKFLDSTGLSYFYSLLGNTFLKNTDISSWAKEPTKPSYTLDEIPDGEERKITELMMLTEQTDSVSKLGDGTTSDDTHGEIRNATGRTVVWNQLFIGPGTNNYGLTISFQDGIITLDGTCNTAWKYYIFSTGSQYYGRKFYIKGKIISGSVTKAGDGDIRLTNGWYTGLRIGVNESTIYTFNNNAYTGSGVQTTLGLSGNIGDYFDNLKIKIYLVDLTLMFGAGNEPSTVEEFEALFPLDYYAYNAGTMLGGTVTGFKSTDADGNTLSNLSIPITTLTGKQENSDTSEVMFPYGLNGIGSVKDEIDFEHGTAVRRIGVVDLNSIYWQIAPTQGADNVFIGGTITDIKTATSGNPNPKFLLNGYTATVNAVVSTRLNNKEYSVIADGSKYILIKDTSYSVASDFKTAMYGVLFYYELATPITYTIDSTPSTVYSTRKDGKEMWLPAHSSAPTAAPLDWSTAYGMNVVEEIDKKAPLESPSLTGTPTAPTAAIGTNTTQIATTAFVQGMMESLQKAVEMLMASTVVVEGYLRVAGSSDPTLSYRTYALDDNVQQGVQVKRESVFHIFHPCLVGNNITGNVGKILHVLQKLGARTATTADSSFTEGQAIWLDTDGMPHAIDGSEGDVMVVNIVPYWQIAGHYEVDGTTLDVFLRSRQPFTWNGIEAAKEEPWGDAPDYCVAHNDDGTTVMHSVYNPAWAGSYTEPYGVTGRYVVTEEDGELVETYDSTATVLGGSGGLHTTDIALYTGEQYAMNMNPDNTKSVPYYNHHARRAELLWAGLAAEGGTFDSHKKERFGSGFSSNDIANEATYGTGEDARNGLRIYDKDNTAKYYGFSSNVRFLKAESSGTNYGCFCVNAYRNAWHCMEAYRVLCHAVSNGIGELEWFAFEGNKYKWRSVQGYDGPAKGEATAVVFKMMSTKAHADAVDPTDLTTSIAGNRIDIVVSTGLWHGITTQASPSWWTSGLIFTETDDGQYDAYMERDQAKLIKSEDGTIDASEQFDFEKQYLHVGTFANGNGYRKDYADSCLMLSNSDANKSGAALHTYVGGYNYLSGTAPATGKKSSRGFRRGSGAYSAGLSPLYVYAYYVPSSASSACAFGTCVRIES